MIYVAVTPFKWEVTLTSGDPKVLSPHRQKTLMERLAAIPPVAVVGFHTRRPVVAFDRIINVWILALRTPCRRLVVLPTNRPDAPTPNASAAMARLVDAQIPLLSQSIPPKDLSDDLVTLVRLIRDRAKPYNIHHADPAKGASLFGSTIAESRTLTATLQGRLPAYVCRPLCRISRWS